MKVIKSLKDLLIKYEDEYHFLTRKKLMKEINERIEEIERLLLENERNSEHEELSFREMLE